MNIQTRIAIEKQIVTLTIKTLIAAGYTLRVHDGEEWASDRHDDKEVLLAACFSTDVDELYVYDNTCRSIGWVQFIYGNDGWDVVANHTVNLESVLTPVTELSDKLCDQYAGK